MHYAIINEHGPENFSACPPDFPGCAPALDIEVEMAA